MKITKKRLKQIIKEEFSKQLNEKTEIQDKVAELVGLNWKPYGYDSLTFLDVDDAMGLENLPLNNKKPIAHFNYWKGKGLKGAYTNVFGTMSAQSYGKKSPGINHPTTGKFMLPPGWSITAYALATMAKDIRASLKGASENEKKEIARVNGYIGDGVSRLEAALADVEKLEQVLEA